MRLASAVTSPSRLSATETEGTARLLRIGASFPVGVELAQEQGAALLLVDLADGRGRPAQGIKGTEEATVRLVPPPHIARTPPAGAPQGVQAPVVADPGIGVGLDLVPGQQRELGPGLQEARMGG